MNNWIGQSVSRVEDEQLLKGQGRYLADVKIPGTLEAVFVRSIRPHAAIRGIDKQRALAAPGVVAVFTHKDIAGRTEPICVAGEVHTPERLLKALKPLDRVHPTPLFPERRTTYAGQPLAMVVAETLSQALDATELVEVDYEELPAVTDPIAALEADAPLVEPEFGSNLVLSVGITTGNPKEAFKRGDLVTVEEEFVTQRYVASPLETRGLQVMPDPVTGQLTVWSSTQTAHALQMLMAVSLRMPAESIRVVACDVGGGFGQKGVQSAEDMLVAFAARELARPVRWVESRSENLSAAPHARDQIHRIALAATREGRLVALRDEAVMNCGAYNFLGMVVPYNSLSHLLGPYDVPNASILVKGVLTHTTFTTPYRGAGRPEAVFAMERIVERRSWASSRPNCARATSCPRKQCRTTPACSIATASPRSATPATFRSCCAARASSSAWRNSACDRSRRRRRVAIWASASPCMWKAPAWDRSKAPPSPYCLRGAYASPRARAVPARATALRTRRLPPTC